MPNIQQRASVSPDLERHVLRILKVKSPLDSPDLDPTEYINRLFPNEQSLSSVDTVINKLQAKADELSVEAERLTGSQSESNGGAQELDNAKQAIQELFQKIQDIKLKAAQSESMVQEITQDVKSLDYAKRHLTHSVTVLKRLQMLVTAVDQLETMSRNKQFKESAQLLEAVIQLMQHFKSYKGVQQIAELSDRITQLQKDLDSCVLREFENGFQKDGTLTGQTWLLHDACLVATALGDKTKEKIIKRYVDLQLSDYRQIFKSAEEVSQLDNISRRYAWLKRLLKTLDEKHADIFPPQWCVTARVCEQFCNYTRSDMEQVLAASPQPDVKELLHALQLTIEFEAQLTKRYEKLIRIGGDRQFNFTKSISSSFQPYLWVYIDAEDRTLTNMINSYFASDMNADDDGSMVVLPSSTDLFYFYRETLVQCAKFSTGKPFYDLCQLFTKHLHAYCNVVLLGGVSKNEKSDLSTENLRFITLALNTADYCCMTTSQLEEKLKEKVDEEFREKVSLESVKEAFMSAVSMCIDAAVRSIGYCCEPYLQQMIRLPWSVLDTVGDQSEYVSQLQDVVKRYATVVGRTVANKRYFRTFSDRFVESFLSSYLLSIFRCKHISEIGAEQMLLDTHALKTLLLDIPLMGAEGAVTVPTLYGKFVSKGISKAETILKTVMTPTDPIEGYVENYLFLIGDSSMTNFSRVLELKGVKKPDQGPLLDAFQRRITQQPSSELAENSNILPAAEISGAAPPASNLPSAITTSLSTIATSASNFNPNALPPFARNIQGSPTMSSASPTTDGTPLSAGGGNRATGRLNENFRKLVMTGMAFRKDLQERREQQNRRT
ncbi:vacuolar protein sorting 53 [Zychaea mexicana]|uniref:vacuolar protein sorting 53 n=1 Tax=Zychaea mexicana TaxID=64656 RepID=UPI0022FF1729|nr:vacuolar protein sorting 53 [Zychaea mexicana]KAI9492204.1 vacuolar protein sorting 53 [Zychaea mexicana]